VRLWMVCGWLKRLRVDAGELKKYFHQFLLKFFLVKIILAIKSHYLICFLRDFTIEYCCKL
jgi:hypothetical protein